MLQQLNSPRSSWTNIYSCSKMAFLSFIWVRGPGDHGTVWLVTRAPWHQMSVTVTGLSSGPRVLPAPFCPQQFPLNLRHENTGAGAGANIAALSLCEVCFRRVPSRLDRVISRGMDHWIFHFGKSFYFNLTAFKYLPVSYTHLTLPTILLV